jgi:hypothetical protein
MMTPDEEYQARGAYATFLKASVERILGIALPDSFRGEFLRHTRYVGGYLDYEDLGSFLLLECQERKQSREPTSTRDVYLILDKIRHRITRKLSNRPLQIDDDAGDIYGMTADPSAVAAVNDVLSRLSSEDQVILTLAMELGVELTAKHTGKALSTIYRRLTAIRDILGEVKGSGVT